MGDVYLAQDQRLGRRVALKFLSSRIDNDGEARDRLSESDYLVGFFYFRQRWYPGAIDGFKDLLKNDPEFTGRDAVYFYLAESLAKVKLEAEALPYLEKLIDEFERSEYLEEAHRRANELKAQVAAPKPSGF